VVDQQTFILKDCKTEVGRNEIKPGIGVRAIGKISDGDLLSFVLFLEEQKNYGTIVGMEPNGAGYDLEFKPFGATDPINIFLPDDAEVALEDDGEIDKDLLAQLVYCEPRKARITFNETDPEMADFVEVKDEVIQGIIKTTDPDSRKITLQGSSEQIIQVQDLAIIIKNDDKINFKKLKYNDKIKVFGLSACAGDEVHFYGFLIIVVDD
jgi:Cu/Ag efflux protein CusF